jgi:hypothetical protein
MNKILKSTVVSGLAVLLLGASMSAMAGFTGAYAPANWTLTNQFNAITNPLGNTAVPDADPATSILLTAHNTSMLDGNGNPTNSGSIQTNLLFTTLAGAAGAVSFHWDYLATDSESLFFRAGYQLGGQSNLLTLDGTMVIGDVGGDAHQFGDFSFNVAAGQSFGFFVDSIDSQNGFFDLTISNFTAPPAAQTSEVPEPGTLALLGLGLVGIAALRKRKPV